MTDINKTPDKPDVKPEAVEDPNVTWIVYTDDEGKRVRITSAEYAAKGL